MLTEEQHEFLKSLWEPAIPIGRDMALYRGGDELRQYTEPEPYEGQDRIVNYLRHAGFCYAISMSGGKLMCDGEFCWGSSLADIVENCNLRLEPEFEKAVLSDPKRMSRLRRLLLDHGIHTWET